MSGRLSTLCRLQWIMAWRQPGGTPYERFFFLAILVPSLFAAGAGMAFAMFRISRRIAAESPHHMGLFLTGIAGFLALCYLVSVALERNSTLGVDFSRLVHFPVPPGAVVASQVFGYCVNPLFVGFPAVLFLGCAAGILASGRHLMALWTVAGAILWVVQLSLVITFVEVLKLQIRAAPKLARVVLIAVVLGGIAGLVAWISVGGTAAEQHYFGRIAAFAKAAWGRWGPWIELLPGVSPLTWLGGGPRGAGVLAASLAEITSLAWASSALVRRLTREGVSAASTAGVREPLGALPSRTYPWERWGWWPHFQKELRCILRERTQVIALLSLCFAAFLLPRLAEEIGFLEGEVSQFVIPFALAGLLSLGTLNQFGLEATALPLVLTSPSPRWRTLFGKNLMGFLLLVLLLAGQEAVRTYQGAGGAEIAADLLLGLGTLAVLSGLGNYFSMLFPYPAAVPGKNLFPQVSQARLMLISLYQLVYMGIAGNALLPVLAGRYAMSQFADSPRVWSLAAGVTGLYAAGLYGILLAGAGRLLLRLGPHLFEKLQKSSG